jgi:hypothetical protein
MFKDFGETDCDQRGSMLLPPTGAQASDDNACGEV